MRQIPLAKFAATPWIAVVILCVLTVGALHSGLRYQSPPNGPLAVRSLEARPGNWDRTPSGVDFIAEQGRETARLAAVRAGRIAVLRARLVLPTGLDALRIDMEMRAMAVAAGSEAWQTGRVQVLGHDANGRYLWYWPRDVAWLSGESDWRPFHGIIPLGPDLAFADLVVYNGAQSGAIGLRSARVTGLVERPAFSALRYGLLAAWALVGLWVMFFLIRASRRRVGVAALVGCALLALTATLIPQPAFHRVSAPIESTVQSLLAAIAEDPAPVALRVARDDAEKSDLGAGSGRAARQAGEARPAGGSGQAVGRPAPAQLAGPAPKTATAGKSRPTSAATPRRSGASFRVRPPARDYPFSFKSAGHFFVFLLLGLAAFFAFPGVPAARRLGYLLLFAVATETLQLFVITRSSTLKDLAIDAAGLLCAAGLPAVARSITALARAWSRRLSRPAARP